MPETYSLIGAARGTECHGDAPPTDRPTTAGPIRLHTSAQSVSRIGSWMQRTATGWLAWDLTHSAPWVGALALMELVSLIWVAPLAGTCSVSGR
jgi:hypothetical protein